jgi:hypothetical protein
MQYIFAEDLGERHLSINLPAKPNILNVLEIVPGLSIQVAKIPVCLRRHSSEHPQFFCDIIAYPEVIDQSTRLNGHRAQIDSLSAIAQRCLVPIYTVGSAGDAEAVLFVPAEVEHSVAHGLSGALGWGGLWTGGNCRCGCDSCGYGVGSCGSWRCL